MPRRAGHARKPDPMAKFAPQYVQNQPAAVSDSGVRVVASYFSRVKGSVEPGLVLHGEVGDARRFVKTTDADGNPLPIEFRWGSEREGCAEKNYMGGYVECKINPLTRELDPDGQPVVMQPGRGRARHLLVRQTGEGTWADRRAAEKQSHAISMMRKSRTSVVNDVSSALKDVAEVVVGYEQNVESVDEFTDAAPE